jgi:hypothetical protein
MEFGYFIAHCVCEWRFAKLLWMIETQTIEQVMIIRQHHLKHKRNPKYDILEKALKERLG